jgi:hypothetical protein
MARHSAHQLTAAYSGNTPDYRCGFRVLVYRHHDCLNMLKAPPFPGCESTDLTQGFEPG